MKQAHKEEPKSAEEIEDLARLERTKQRDAEHLVIARSILAGEEDYLPKEWAVMIIRRLGTPKEIEAL